MDAKITKSRLGNLLSYDWLKILMVLIASIFAFVVLFTTIATRPRDQQVFIVYGYTGLKSGSDMPTLSDKLESGGVFSYDILRVEASTFGDDSYANVAFTARRAAGEGTAMFVTDITETNDKGEVTKQSSMEALWETTGLLLDTERYMRDCETYLKGFFGSDLSGELDEGKAKACFLARNGKDKRYKTDAQKQAGIEQEKQRLISLRDDYLYVTECFERGIYTHTYRVYEEKDGARGIDMSGLSALSKIVYYFEKQGEENVKVTKNINLVLFDNHDPENDLRYETVTFLSYLAQKYGTAPA